MASIQEALTDIQFDFHLTDDEIVSDAVVILRVTSLADGRNSVGFARSATADEVIVRGLLDCAREINVSDWAEDGE